MFLPLNTQHLRGTDSPNSPVCNILLQLQVWTRLFIYRHHLPHASCHGFFFFFVLFLGSTEPGPGQNQRLCPKWFPAPYTVHYIV